MKTSLKIFFLMVIAFTLLTGCSKKPSSAIENFYSAKSWDERKNFILDSDGLKESDVISINNKYEVQEITLLKELPNKNKLYNAKILRENLDGEKKVIAKQFVIAKVNDQEKIDFKTMLKYNEMTLAEYIDKGHTEPVKFWVKVEVDDVLQDILKEKVLWIWDGNDPTTIVKIIDGTSVSDNKLYDYAISGNKERVQIEITNIIEKDWGRTFYSIEKCEIVQFYPIEE